MSAATKMSPAKTERIRALAVKLAEAAAEVRRLGNGHGVIVGTREWRAFVAADSAWDDARIDLIAECEAPDTEAA